MQEGIKVLNASLPFLNFDEVTNITATLVEFRNQIAIGLFLLCDWLVTLAQNQLRLARTHAVSSRVDTSYT